MFKEIAFLAVPVLLTGCASITGDTVQSIRVETKLADGTTIDNADCELFNEYGTVRVKTPGSATVRRSSTDLNVQCRKDELPEASGRAISRANGGMWGNIIFGGGIGAVIDHNKGTAYTYPQWMQMTFGRVITFDRSDDKDGQPSIGRDQIEGSPSVDTPAVTSSASPSDTKSIARTDANPAVIATAESKPN